MTTNISRRNVACQVSADMLDFGSQIDQYRDNSKFKLNWRSCTVISFLVYILFCGIMILFPSVQAQLIYLNNLKLPYGDFTDLQRFGLLNARNIEIVTDDNITLRGYHACPPTNVGKQSYRNLLILNNTSNKNAGGTSGNSGVRNLWDRYYDEQLFLHAERIVIVLHGNGASRAMGHRIDIVKSLASQFDAHVIAMDYRGFADSDSGVLSEESTYRDSISILNWVLDKTGKCDSAPDSIRGSGESTRGHGKQSPSIYVYGHSLGTGIGVDLMYRLVNNNITNRQGRLYEFGNSCASYRDFYRNVFPEAVRSRSNSYSESVGVVSEVNNTSDESGSLFSMFGKKRARVSNDSSAVSMRTPSETKLVNGLILDSPFTSLPLAALDHPLGAVFRIFPVVTDLL